MELTINYNHEARRMSEQLGSTKERWDEIEKLSMKAVDSPHLGSKPLGIEWVISQLKDVQPCDLVIVGYMFG